MEGVLVMKNVSVKQFSFFIGGSVGEQERVCQTLQLHSMDGSIGDQERVCQTFSFFNGRSIGDQERVSQTLQLHQLMNVPG